MKLYYSCSACQKENACSCKVSNRYELKMQKGDTIKESCTACAKINKIPINEVYAKPNRVLVSIFLLIFAIITAILFNKGIVAYLTLFIPFAVWQSEKSRASNFNKVRV